ncbi:MAG: bifunctional ADP-dependent NAD(P)H-hydrate dehydratase/NAD(P)H-hydrate epimerase, partial [Acidimicrobiia bacterium]|nr:bifunctional ADP-dependent NAD(P)H-hydrate dehydratase/NAD(P)H-hydrate epimerase [Acidimicrobiia bacterium]
LAARGAQRTGAGYVRLSVPGGPVGGALPPVEVVGVELAIRGWAAEVLDGLGRFRALVLGPGLGRDEDTMAEVRRLVAEAPVPLVVDGDGLHALGLVGAPTGAAGAMGAPRVLTPHDGEFEQLSGRPPGPDRFAAARSLAGGSGCVVLLKGPTTIVAGPTGEALAVTEGPATLATAGTGDVLSGVIGALLARGVAPLRAAAAGAFLHGRAARLGPAQGLVAGDVADLLPAALAELRGEPPARAPRPGRGYRGRAR